MADYYHILGVPHDATQDEIKKSYHRLALRFHPDKAGPGEKGRFEEIQTAYEVLSSPQKRSIYDQYGAAAVDNPVSDALFVTVGSHFVIWFFTVFIAMFLLMVVLFVAFISAYVDGNLPARDQTTVHDDTRNYWNYVKVFSPLFVLDIMLGIPVIVTFFVCLYARHFLVAIETMTLLCFLALTIIIPVTKDANDMTQLLGEDTFRQWRIWLIPLYASTSLYAILSVIKKLPTQRKYEQLKAYGMELLWRYTKVSFILTLVRGAMVVLFGFLIACRADELIVVDYFIVLVIPFVVFSITLLADLVYFRISFAMMERIPLGCMSIFCTVLPPLFLISLTFASVLMISLRLNDVDQAIHGGQEKIFSLSIALIPVYILLGILFLALLLLACSAISGIRRMRGADVQQNAPDEEKQDRRSNDVTTSPGGVDGDGVVGRNKDDDQHYFGVLNGMQMEGGVVNSGGKDDRVGDRSSPPAGVRYAEETLLVPLTQRRLSDID